MGERRAQAALAYLVSRGVAAGRMSVISYGEERPACLERHRDVLGEESPQPFPDEA